MTIYMQINGIDGDVTAKGHENWIALEAIDFNVKRLLSTDPGRIADRESTRPVISEIHIKKKMDKSSAYLFGESCVGKAKDQVQIDICQTGSTLSPYAQLTLENVIVSHYELQASDLHNPDKTQSDYPTEQIRLNFDKIELKYTPYDSQNMPQSPIPAGYNLSEATAA